MLFILYLIFLLEHKGTKNPAQFDMNGIVFVVKDSKESLFMLTVCKQLYMLKIVHANVQNLSNRK